MPHPEPVVILTGLSGSGKSVALAALEDAGYYCVDNLPAALLVDLVRLQHTPTPSPIAVAIDIRSMTSLPQLRPHIQQLQAQGIHTQMVFLDASTEALVHRFSETRRSHPLSTSSDQHLRMELVQAINAERELLSDLRDASLIIDTSLLRPSQLRTHIKALLSVQSKQLTLLFESFAFKRGVPLDADFVFDVRMLPNPYYELHLRALSGKDQQVIDFLEKEPLSLEMIEHITQFLHKWLPTLNNDHRSYVTVAIGCTGGQHRSVFIVEKLSPLFESQWVTKIRHRELQ